MQSKVSSYSDLIREWERLLSAVLLNALSLPSAEVFRVSLAEILPKVKDAKARQDALQADRQAVTQELEGLIAQGKEISIRLRGVARADLGPRNEQLVHFGVAPLRKRAPRTAKAPVAPADPPPQP
jgi:hypothetical protein